MAEPGTAEREAFVPDCVELRDPTLMASAAGTGAVRARKFASNDTLLQSRLPRPSKKRFSPSATLASPEPSASSAASSQPASSPPSPPASLPLSTPPPLSLLTSLNHPPSLNGGRDDDSDDSGGGGAERTVIAAADSAPHDATLRGDDGEVDHWTYDAEDDWEVASVRSALSRSSGTSTSTPTWRSRRTRTFRARRCVVCGGTSTPTSLNTPPRNIS